MTTAHATTSTIEAIRATLRAAPVPHHEPPSVVRRRRIAVVFVGIAGAVLLGLLLTRTPGDSSFYWLALVLATVWALGSLVSGPLHLGCINWRGRNRRPVIVGSVVGLALSAVFVVGGLVVREIPVLAEPITQILAYANQGALWVIVVIALVNGVAEEMFFRGSLYTALGHFHPVLISTVGYILATMASGNIMLGFAAIILGAVNAWQRRITGGVLAPVLTHVFWGLVMVLALPPMFGI